VRYPPIATGGDGRFGNTITLYVIPRSLSGSGITLIEVSMFSIQAAVNAAKEFAVDVFQPRELLWIRLEEVEKSEDDLHWILTLSWAEESNTTALIKAVGSAASVPREYKVFHVDRRTGEVEAMKIREGLE